ncbi:MAG: hypothetical protein QT05_C0047G0054 [archaeon GW2011_AR13]|nr:MAG: hypothetical protein QT05_C0047G0054 [archaeon GW2011_AR13]HIG94678.1 hypothetical protein [Nanoarchaeota archaeon]HIH63474.1 hypothetical protein [Nanoarchaeota archaeon]HIJ09404.1 hypothetical protein [Nanoarchaeota archaeon]HLD55607.1 hypothetical protein [Candidatus Nanoarchaeia archaeon]
MKDSLFFLALGILSIMAGYIIDTRYYYLAIAIIIVSLYFIYKEYKD